MDALSRRRDDLDLEPITLEDVLQKARGPRWLGIHAKTLIFWGLHVFIISGLLVTDTYLLQAAKGIAHVRLQEGWYLLWLSLVLAVHTANYLSLFGSDPGWLPLETAPGDQADHCLYCGAKTVLRSRHDFKTGQCVLKFDHFCWMLGTAIGDRNQLRFWLFNCVQTYLVLWGFALVFSRLAYCGVESIPGSCWIKEPWRIAGLFYMAGMLYIALGVFGGLFLFHTYLAASNQTTYEVMKD